MKKLVKNSNALFDDIFTSYDVKIPSDIQVVNKFCFHEFCTHEGDF